MRCQVISQIRDGQKGTYQHEDRKLKSRRVATQMAFSSDWTLISGWQLTNFTSQPWDEKMKKCDVVAFYVDEGC